ncbi:hypothetical protein IQ255_25025 [Pleurocapsales cyanobacterium LEGE 10410]|nr:hypothetical protein [Pleurocapsales cyanobacterium LEGE 10410]
MKIRGIKQSQTIKLLEQTDNIADGEEIPLEISALFVHPLAHLSTEERQNRIKQVLGAWRDKPEINDIFTEID